MINVIPYFSTFNVSVSFSSCNSPPPPYSFRLQRNDRFELGLGRPVSQVQNKKKKKKKRKMINLAVCCLLYGGDLVKSTTAAQVGNLVSRSYETRSLVLLAYYLRIAGHVVGALPTLSDIHRHVFKDQVGGHLYPVSKPNETVCDIICRVCKCIIVSSPSREIRMAPYGSRLPRIRFFFSRLRVKRGNQTRTHCTPSLRIILFINRGIKSDRFYGSLSKSL